MTQCIPINHALYLLTAVLVALWGATVPVAASEVTGTLSTDTSVQSTSSTNVSGTVTNDSGGGSSNRTSATASSAAANTQSGSVLGTSTPGFPNAGIGPSNPDTTSTWWSTLVTFVKNLFSF